MGRDPSKTVILDTNVVIYARQFLEFLEPARRPSGPPPRVDPVPPSRVNINSPFFSSLIDSYPEFSAWWSEKVVPEARTTLVVGEPEDPQGLTVIKENDADYGLPPHPEPKTQQGRSSGVR